MTLKPQEMSGGCSSPPPEELLGSLTTVAGGPAVRTSARVIKKMKLDSSSTTTLSGAAAAQDAVDQIAGHQRKDPSKENEKFEESPTSAKPPKLITKMSKIQHIKRRSPKNVWSATEKNLFFEALNEYGKDFDAITAYICNKMKRKGVQDASTKTKHQVSTFYYRTWQKVAKHVNFGNNVKKGVQELYGLINYGEMRKRLESGVTSKFASRLQELVVKGVVALRSRGKTVRVRTPVCRALRRLNQLDDWGEQVRLPARVCVVFRARDVETWARVQGVAHNPRALAPTPPALRLRSLLTVIQARWRHSPDTMVSISKYNANNVLSSYNSLSCQINIMLNPNLQTALKFDDEVIPNEHRLKNGIGNCDKSAQELKRDVKIEVNHTTSSEASTHKSNNVPFKENESDDCPEDAGKIAESMDRADDASSPRDRMDAEELRHNEKEAMLFLHVGPKPGVDLNFPSVNVSEHITSYRISFGSCRERLTTNPVIISNGLQSGGGRFKNQKRHRKDSGEIDASSKKLKNEVDSCDKGDVFDIDETANDGMDIMEFKVENALMQCDDYDKDFEKDKDFLSELEDDDKYVETDGENDMKPFHGDEGKQNQNEKFSLNKKQHSDREKRSRISNSVCSANPPPSSLLDSPEQEGVRGTSGATSGLLGKTWNRDILLQQIKKGWSVYDSGDLTIGDLYLMFGNDSKLELDYWWAEASAPISGSSIQQMKQSLEHTEGSEATKDPQIVVEETELDKVPEVDPMLMSPTHTSQDSNDTEKEIMSPDHRVSSSVSGLTGFPLVSKMVNCPGAAQVSPGSPNSAESAAANSVGARLKKLLSLARMYNTSRARVTCPCGHYCLSSRVKRNLAGIREEVPNRVPEFQWSKGNKSQPLQGQPSRPTGPVQSVPSVKSQPQQGQPSRPTGPVQSLPSIKSQPQQGLPLRPNGPVQPMPSIDFGLPPWTRRAGRSRKKSPPPKEPPPPTKILPRPPPFTVPLPPLVSGYSVRSTTSTSAAATPAPAPLLRVLPALRPRPSTPTVVTVRPMLPERTINAFIVTEIIPKQPSETAIDNVKSEKIDSDKNNQVTVYSVPCEDDSTKWETVRLESSKTETLKDVTPNLANLLDISLPSNIGDDNSLGITLKSDKNTDNFTGLLPAESMSMSPSRLLKENDDQWLEAEVHNFSLSSFLGHLEAPPHNVTTTTSSSTTPVSTVSTLVDSRQGKVGDESVDTHLQCLISETSIDYMAKFEDLAKRASAETTK